MQGWGFNPSTFAAIGSMGTFVAIFITLVGIALQIRENTRARNLGAILEIYADFIKRWESGWQSVLTKVSSLNLEQRHAGEVGRQFIYILNWLDWMGRMVKRKWVDIEVFESLRPRIQDILRESAHIILKDTKEEGKNYWGGLWFMAEHPKITISITEEAEKLIQKWGTQMVEDVEGDSARGADPTARLVDDCFHASG